MTKINANTKKGQSIINALDRRGYRDIYDAYQRPSSAKVRSFEEIQKRAWETEGYNHDLKVTGANSSFYSTVYSSTVGNVTTVVYDTYADTYVVEVVNA